MREVPVKQGRMKIRAGSQPMLATRPVLIPVTFSGTRSRLENPRLLEPVGMELPFFFFFLIFV